MSGRLSIAITSSILLGSSAIIGLWWNSHESIWDQVSSDAIPNNASLDGLWAEVRTKLSSSNTAKTEELKQILSNTNSDPKGEKIRDWCYQAYKSTFKHLFKKQDQELLLDVKLACILKIKDKLGTYLNSEGNQQDFQNNLQILKNEPDQNLDKKLKDLKDLEDKEPNPTKNWIKLRDWCFEIYEKGYLGENTWGWNLSQKLCKKTITSAR